MKHASLVYAAMVVFAAATALTFAATGAADTAQPSSASPSQVARGRYLVVNVGMCSDCHGAGLRGGPLDFAPAGPLPPGVHFATKAPNLIVLARSIPRASLVKFLETGMFSDGRRANPPMPNYQFSPQDASSVVTYLRSLAR